MTHHVPRSDFQQRLENIRRGMTGCSLDALIVFSQRRGHVRYVSGYNPNYHTNSALALLPLKGEPILWIKFPFDLSRAKAMSWFQDVRVSPYEDNCAMVPECAEAIRQLHLERGHIGLVASDLAVDEMSVSLDQRLRGEMPQVQFEPASDLLNSVRLIKSATEIRSLRQSAQLAEVVAEALRKAIRPGETDFRAVLAAERPARSEGARCDIIISTDASRLAYPPKNLKFRAQSTVTCEITIEFNGYWVQICRTFSVSTPSAEQKQTFSVSQRAYRAGLAAARSGNTVGAVWNAIYESFLQDGCEKWIQYGPGHGVGLDLPELYLIEQNCKAELRSNMVLVVHPGVLVPQRGIGWTGGPVVVGETHARPLDHPQTDVIEI